MLIHTYKGIIEEGRQGVYFLLSFQDYELPVRKSRLYEDLSFLPKNRTITWISHADVAELVDALP